MAKIYNEIIIDMNPESSSYGETLYEDSFEYSGDMMLFQAPKEGDYASVKADPDAEGWFGGFYVYQYWNGKWVEKNPGDIFNSPTGTVYDSVDAFPFEPPPDAPTPEEQALQDLTLGERMATGEYGMEGLTSETFLGMTEDKAYDYLLATKYGGVLPTVAGKTAEDVEKDIRRLLSTYLPKPGQLAAEEVGFLAEQYGGQASAQLSAQYTQYDLNEDGKVDILDVNMADPSQKQTFADIVTSGEAEPRTISFAESLTGRQAGLAKETTMSSLRGQAGQLRGAGMRAGIAGQEAIGKGFQTSQDVYALAGETAGLGYRKGMYGLEEKAETKWESDFTTFLNSLPPAIG